jgi:hypothetical protein
MTDGLASPAVEFQPDARSQSLRASSSAGADRDHRRIQPGRALAAPLGRALAKK